jgi:hypothetical protein
LRGKQLGQRGQAVHHRHLDIQDDDLDIVPAERLDRRLAVADGGDDLDRAVLLERSREQPANDGGVVDHHHPKGPPGIAVGAAGGGLGF